ncbi:MAG: C39 family peptidase [Desulfuromonadaceae bacterium]|nr:C39 family peptidase [Desulfuromonadaceae bacterium]
MIPYLVCEFSRPTVSNLVKECFGSDFPDIFKKTQLVYLFHYLKDLGAKSVLLEREYIDKDYLEDYSRYYVKCFNNGGHKCARLHFFNSKIDHTTLDKALKTSPSSEECMSIVESYLGFIVIKPLSQTFIGKTCLKQYSSLGVNEPGNKFLFKRYDVNLFGIKLNIDTVAFQEQDTVVSACATTAIWTALHGSQEKSVRQIPACSEITTNAINHIDGSSNRFPNDGLTNKQILRALDAEGLKYHNESLNEVSAKRLFDTVKYHIDSNIPLILGVVIRKQGEESGGHAVTILGYAEKDVHNVLYVHDDRLGPFAKAVITEVGKKCELTLQRKDDNGNWEEPHEFLMPQTLIVPTHKKVRISYELPRNTCQLLLTECKKWHLKTDTQISKEELDKYYSFNLKLCGISELKNTIFESDVSLANCDIEIAQLKKAQLLTHSFARFQWVASFQVNGIPAFKILFDATDIPQGNAVSWLYIENGESSKFPLSIINKCVESNISITEQHSKNFFSSLLKNFKKSKDNYADYLSTTYGDLRAPKYINKEECINGYIQENNSVRVFYDAVDDDLDEIYPEQLNLSLIWAISSNGALLIGEDKGHPTLTGFKPARISGELKKYSGKWVINYKSGRYSRDYSCVEVYLKNALNKFRSIFWKSRDALDMEKY